MADGPARDMSVAAARMRDISAWLGKIGFKREIECAKRGSPPLFPPPPRSVIFIGWRVLGVCLDLNNGTLVILVRRADPGHSWQHGKQASLWSGGTLDRSDPGQEARLWRVYTRG